MMTTLWSGDTSTGVLPDLKYCSMVVVPDINVYYQ